MSFPWFTHSFLLSLILLNPLAANTFPRGCEVLGFNYEQNFLVLNESGRQTFYLIQNRGDATIELERPAKNSAFMTPPLHVTLDPMNWSAFASDEKNAFFKCYKRVGEKASLIDCRDVLDVCQYPRVRFALSNMGNYWISSNKPQQSIIRDAINSGIYLKW